MNGWDFAKSVGNYFNIPWKELFFSLIDEDKIKEEDQVVSFNANNGF
ncbi:MAG: hypothetical protein LBR15_10985 [Methanobrevibacter sp.]|jgi:hypothetical protein|nr:hypothetical protein [Candidatus Methanovirga australis]